MHPTALLIQADSSNNITVTILYWNFSLLGSPIEPFPLNVDLITSLIYFSQVGGLDQKRQGTQPIITPLIGRLSSTTTSSEDPDPHHTNSNDVVESVRRNLILSSAAILSSALLGIPSPSQAALDESENRRISTFERTAPSVVFIDTFTEKQDAFSPNVMEVPLGTGSGFVWDKEGHIGTCLTHIG